MTKHKKTWTAEELLALELPDDARGYLFCDCRAVPTHDADGSPHWPQACSHVFEYAPGDLEPEEWYAQFPDTDAVDKSNRNEWAQALRVAFGWDPDGEDYHDRPPPSPAPDVLLADHEARVTLLAERFDQGKGFWHPLDGVEAERKISLQTTGKKKKKQSGKFIIKGDQQ